MKPDHEPINVAALVRIEGWSRWRAWRYLRRLEEEFGDDVVRRDAQGRMYTDLAGLGVVRRRQKKTPVVNRVSALESKLENLEHRLDKLAAELRRRTG